jgi:hypothetical protein
MTENNPLIDFARIIYPDLTLDWFQLLMLELAYRCWMKDPDCQNLQFWLPTGYGKSWIMQIIGAWILSLNPATKIMVGTNSDSLAKEDAGSILAIIKSPQFAEHYYTPVFKSESVTEFRLEQGGGVHAASLSGQQLGWRADVYLLDDPTRSISDAWAEGSAKKLRTQYQASLSTRLTPGAPIILTAQRLKTDDLPGWLRDLAYQNPLNKQWAILCLPMMPNTAQYPFIEYTRTKQRTPLTLYKTLASIKDTRFSFDERQAAERIQTASDNPIVSNAMLQQWPSADDEVIWPAECWGEIAKIAPNEIQYITIGVDTAIKTAGTNDYSAWCVVAYGPRFGYVITDYIETRVRTQQLVDITAELWMRVRNQFGVEPRLSIERAGSGEQLCNLLESQHPHIKFFESNSQALHTKKRLRASGVEHFTSSGSVAILTTMKPEKKQHFIDTMLNFGSPNWHDDLCDSYVWAMIPFSGSRSLRKKEDLATAQEQVQLMERLETWIELEDEIAEQMYHEEWGDLEF